MSMRFYATFTILLGLVPAVEANEKLIRKTYPVADLVVPIEGAPGCNLGKPSASPCTKDTANALPHSLIELITKTVDRLVAASERPDLTYKVTILNSGAVNAFALPT